MSSPSALINQRTYKCGCTHSLFMGDKGRFDLFSPQTEGKEFYTVSMMFESWVTKVDPEGVKDYVCEECVVKREATQRGLRGAERHQWIKADYARTWEGRNREKARKFLALAKKSHDDVVDPSEINELNQKAKANIIELLGLDGKDMLDSFQHLNLFKTILCLPEFLDKKMLMTVFGAYSVWNQQSMSYTGMPSADRNRLVGLARRANLLRALDAGLATKNPADLKL
ncbi:hypothetical protein F4819DRAFT_56488 [Hypoxylon fuscum]|nr:hypothetical protein F4819DRAFT_56488 [Hypoxylon fuscum]